MYVPAPFALSDAETASALGAGGFAQLITSTDDDYLVTPLPLLYRAATHSLVGHVSRANPHWQHAQRPSVAVIAGPQAYISPSLYATKAETGKVVPTWNYDVLVVHGRLVVHDDAGWVRELVGQLTDHHESARPAPWAVSDAPDDFVAAQLRAIVGVELIAERVEGKAKMSQNQPERNQAGVVDGLRRSDGPQDRQVAERVAKRNRL